LWKGHCSVHTRFNVQQIEAFRKKYPEGKVIAHPECTLDVVQAADLSGSTEYIIEAVKNSPKGSVWAVATEVQPREPAREPDGAGSNRRHAGSVRMPVLDDVPRVAEHLLWILEGLLEGEIHNQIVVPDETKRWQNWRRSDARRFTKEGLMALTKERLMAYSVPPLPYDYNALEPHIDEQTMRIHHDKHPRRVRQQPERGAREAPAASEQEHRRP